MIRKLLGIIFLIGAIGVPMSILDENNWVLAICLGVFYLTVSIMFFAYSAMRDKKWWQKAIYVIVCIVLVCILAPASLIIGGVESMAREKGVPSSQLYSELFEDFKVDANNNNSQN